MNKIKLTGKTVKAIITYCILLVAVMITFDKRLQVTYYSIESDKVQSNVRILLLTDFHSNNYGKNASKIMKKVRSVSPDIVLLGGDIYDDVLPEDNADTFVRVLAGEYRCFYVTGNHEYWSKNVDGIKENLRNLGVIVLEGDCETVSVNGQDINICGVDDPVYDYERMYTQLQYAAMASNNGNFTVLLSHRPELVDEYAKYNFDVVLSGHAHGGQIRIPFLLNGLYAPDQAWFPKYAGGKYEIDDCRLIVSRGLDRETIKIPRVFNRPEMVVLDIK